MVVCKYYVEGRCKFGDNCRFEHPDGGGGAQRQLHFDNRDANRYKWTAQQNQTKTSTFVSPPEEIISSLSTMMVTWEQGKMWPFSCLALEKDMPCIPEFSDISADELRFEAYEMLKTSGNLTNYTEKVKQLMVEFGNKRKILQNPSHTVKQHLTQFINNYRQKTQTTDSKSSSIFKPSAFGTSSGSNIIGGLLSSGPTGNTGSVFGGQSSNSVFGGQSSFGSQTPKTGSLFSGQSSGSTFGGQSSGSTFGGQSSGSTFGGQSSGSTSNIFGNASKGNTSGNASANSLFGQGANNSSSLFGQTQGQTTQASRFGQTGNTTESIFGQGQATPGSIFGQGHGQTATGSIFGQGQASVFGQGQTTPESTYGQGQVSGSVFGQGQSTSGSNLFTQTAATTSTQSGFGSTGATNFGIGAAPGVGLFGKGHATPVSTLSNVNNTVYTPLDKLTADEMAHFEADHFILGRVPVKPPPRELCK